MSTTLDEQIEQLKKAIAELEAQRGILGDKAVEAALIPSRQKLADLEAQVEPSRDESPDLPTRQRKLVTLLFMDVVGSTQMTQHLDPEDTLDIMDNVLKQLAAPVDARGGHVTRFMGDGFKVVFGDPVAREDDPEQAIRAGLEIIEIAKSLAQELEQEWEIDGFQVRIGVNTGLVALGGYTEAEDTVMGLPVNLAARIESAAPPGGLLISHNTYRHVRGVFDVQPQEPIIAKGFAEPAPIYLVQRARPRAFRVPMLGVEGVETRMVGRETELKYLQDAMLTAFEEGEGGMVTLTGEAGVGKSRLLYEFQNWVELLPDSVFLFQGRGRQEAQGQPYALLRDLFSSRFQILEDDSSQEARRKIVSGFGEVFGIEVDALMRTHIIGQLLGYDFSNSPHMKGLLNDPEQLRNRSLMYLRDYFQVLSRESPVLIFLEDIHWGDDSSLDVIKSLGEITPQILLLIVCATRPTLFERRPNWSEEKSYYNQIVIHSLSERDNIHLFDEILKLVDDIPDELRGLVISRSEGNPFYLEEIIKMLIEDGVVIPAEDSWQVQVGNLDQVNVPSTLVGVLQARLGSLPKKERIVLQQASVVGRLFWDQMVAHIQTKGDRGNDPQSIPLALSSLRGRELIYQRDESAFTGAIEYLFKHDVLRDVTYESVIKRLRTSYHGLVADWLITNSGDRVDEYSGVIAQHLLLAGRKDLAAEYYSQAGESALSSFSNSEAESFYRQALDLSPSDALRANILSGLGTSLSRQGSPNDAAQILRNAIDLYKKLRDSNHLAEAYARLSGVLWLSNQIEAWEVCQEGLEQLEGSPDSSGYASLLAMAGRLTSEKPIKSCHSANGRWRWLSV